MLLSIQKFSQVGNPDYLKSQLQNCNLVPKIGVGDVIVSYTTTCTSNQSHMLNHLRWMSLYQKSVSIKQGPQTVDYGLRTTDYGPGIWTRYKMRTGEYGLGIKHGLGIKRGLRTADWV